LRSARQIKQSNDRWDRRSLRGERGRDHLRQRLAASSSARAHALALCSNGLAPLDHAEVRHVIYLLQDLDGLDGYGHLKRSREAFEITCPWTSWTAWTAPILSKEKEIVGSNAFSACRFEKLGSGHSRVDEVRRGARITENGPDAYAVLTRRETANRASTAPAN
jgi:hypothetical protein